MNNLSKTNLLLLTDSYKVGHWLQYPPKSERIYSYFESRLPGAKIPFFGLQYLLKEYIMPGITQDDIDEAEETFNSHFGQSIFNRDGWQYVINEYGGAIPLDIRAVPEGVVVDGGNALMTVENNDPNLWWLGNYFDPLFTELWAPCTVAAKSWAAKQVLKRFANDTATDLDVLFKLHDFGFRGSMAVEAAALAGAAHLINFLGTDNLPALRLLKRHYNGMMAGFSIPAAEHSTITTWGENHEAEAYRNMMLQFPKGLVAVVSDSYDIFNATEKIWGERLKEYVEGRDGTLVIRPDSGDPLVVIPRLLRILAEKFGATTNDKGYWVLPSFIRLIQGDGITNETMEAILSQMKSDGWSMENIAFGSGGGLLQKHDRDTYRFAFKASHIKFEGGATRDVFKKPITDIGKVSKAGRLGLVRTKSGRWETIPQDSVRPGTDWLYPVFSNGNLLRDFDLATVRTNTELFQ